jgi:acyl transferase domain-containing protein
MSDIAIIGMSCRFPGADNLHDYWTLLREGRSGISPTPQDRWDVDAHYHETSRMPGKSNAHQGGFLKDIKGFDARFFGISDKEARYMDPQQRLVLEAVWHALEDAHIYPRSLAGSATGVFVGVMMNEYGVQCSADLDKINPFTGSGNGLSMIANRVSYFFDLNGVSLAIDTACSSSLVAVAKACQSLEVGNIDYAIVAGVNLMLNPAMDVFYSQAGLISPSGHCRTFDEKADGIARGEGVGVVILQRASDISPNAADNVYGLIKGCAVNHDGRSNGITAPNRALQEAVIRRAHSAADTSVDNVDYIELHGTGTQIGDPIEAMALGAAINRDATHPRECWIGSVKSNIGHLEAAAGIAALIKCALAIKHGWIPPSINFEAPNKLLKLQEHRLAVVRQLTQWPEKTAPRLAGISSFGLGGTNAHVVLSEYRVPSPVARAVEPRSVCGYWVLPVSAKNPKALRTLAKRYLEEIEALSEDELARFCATAATRRSSFEYRILALGKTPAEMIASLKQAAQQMTDKATPALKPYLVPPVVFAYAGQGSQWLGMARTLLAQFDVFSQAIDQCDALFFPCLGQSIKHLLLEETDSNVIDDTANAQPLIFSYQYALTKQLAVFGIRPAAVVGHSIGEYAAAVCAGVMTLASAVRLVAARGTTIREHGLRGAMVTLHCSEPTALTWLEELGLGGDGDLHVAAINSALHTTLSGTESAIDAIAGHADQQGVRSTRLRVSRAFHTPLPETAISPFRACLSDEPLAQPCMPFVSTLTGLFEKDDLTRPDYWIEQMIQPVRFLDAVQTMAKRGPAIWVEIGAKPVLSVLLNTMEGMEEAFVGSTSERRLNEDDAFMQLLQKLYLYGYDIDWSFYLERSTWRRLPNYPFQHQSYWHDVQPLPAGSRSAASVRPDQLEKVNRPVMPTPTAMSYGSSLDTSSIVRQVIAKVTGINAQTLEPRQLLWEDLGFNSMMVAELRLELERALSDLKGVKFRELSSILTLGDLERFIHKRCKEEPVSHNEKETLPLALSETVN